MKSLPRLNNSLTAVVALVAALVTYYAGAVYSARQYTLETLIPKARTAGYPLATSALSQRQLDILLKVEDPGFYNHGGVDVTTPGAGQSTITQEVAKTMFFERYQPGLDSIKQTLIAAWAVDPLVPKPEQLRIFINTVNLGPGAHGFEQAAQTYFHKPFRQLAEDEYMALVASIAAPEAFGIANQPERNAERVARIRLLMTGQYRPHGVFDVYYGELDPATQQSLPAFSYFSGYYD